MKTFLFLLTFYITLVVYGVSASYAGRGGACSDTSCTEQETAQEATLAAQIEAFLKNIEEKVDPKKLEQLIKQAAEKNPQVGELLKIIQEYGVLTQIKLDDLEKTELPPK